MLVAALPAFAQAQRAKAIREALLDPKSDKVLVASHRADWRNAPENSLAAIENAIEMGVDIVELDVKRTKDGQFILMHDRTLNRTTTGKGNVSEWTLDSIKTLKLRNGCSIRTKHTVPTLEEAMTLAKGRIMVNLDHEADVYFDEVFEILKRTGTVEQVIMKGGKPLAELQEAFGNYLDKVIYMPVCNLDRKNGEQYVNDYREGLHPVAYEFCFGKRDNPLPAKLAKALKGESRIWYNTLWDTLAGGYDDDAALENPDKSYGYLIRKLGARILQTDRPAYLLEYLRRKGWHD